MTTEDKIWLAIIMLLAAWWFFQQRRTAANQMAASLLEDLGELELESLI